jgi:hypothetical protein
MATEAQIRSSICITFAIKPLPFILYTSTHHEQLFAYYSPHDLYRMHTPLIRHHFQSRSWCRRLLLRRCCCWKRNFWVVSGTQHYFCPPRRFSLSRHARPPATFRFPSGAFSTSMSRCAHPPSPCQYQRAAAIRPSLFPSRATSPIHPPPRSFPQIFGPDDRIHFSASRETENKFSFSATHGGLYKYARLG